MQLARGFVQAAILLLLVSCASTPPSSFYVLSADAAGVPGSSGPSVGVGPISIPEYLKRNVMVVNQNQHQLQLASTSRWAESLDSGILRVTSLNLAILLDTQQIQRYPWRRDSPPDYGVSINVINLGIRDIEARLDTEWTLSDARNGQVISQKISQFSTRTAASDPNDIAAAYSLLLFELSEEIALSVRQHSEQPNP